MPKFTFTAIDTAGKERSGTVEAANTELASAQVKSMGLFPTNLAVEGVAPPVRRKSTATPFGSGVKSKRPMVIGPVINAKGLTVFTRQLGTLTQSGLPLLRGLEVLGRQERNPGFKWVLEQLADNIRSGNTFSEGLAMHPKVFNRLYVNMVRAGEAGGVLDVVLNRLARFMEKTEKVKSKIRSAMVYPIVILIVTVVVLAFMMTQVVPNFEKLYADQLRGAPLPALTQSVLGVANFVKDHVFVTLLGIAAFIFVIWLAKRTPQGARVVDWSAFNLPKIGDLARKSSIARFSRTLGTLLSSGVPILHALQITRDTSGNSLLIRAIDYVHDRVKEGEGIAVPLEQTRVFPGMVTSMIDVGEETGELAEMLNRISDAYEEEVDNAVAALTSLIEPVMIVCLAVVVGTVVVALFLPIKDLIERLQHT